MAEEHRPFALLAEFGEPEPMLAGAKALREQGWVIEVYAPFPLEGMREALGFHELAVPGTVLGAGIFGLLFGFLVQAGASLAYPLDIGGRPIVAVPAFGLITMEVGVLFAVFAGIGAMLYASRLPRLNHPLFEVERFSLASDDRFFLALFPSGDDFDEAAARAALSRQHPVDITAVPGGET